jgi:hypothetical protein
MDYKTSVRYADYEGRPTAFVGLTGKHGVGREAIVDPPDVDHMMFFSGGEPWTYSGGKGYHSRGHYVKKQIIDPDGNRIYTELHSWIMNPPKGMRVDHINSNTLDNRRSNLRITDAVGNAHNRVSYASSGDRGIEVRPSGKFRASVYVKGERKLFKNFNTREEAIKARDAVRKRYDIFVYKPKLKSIARDPSKFF